MDSPAQVSPDLATLPPPSLPPQSLPPQSLPPPSELTIKVTAQTQALLARPLHQDNLNHALRHLAKWRSALLLREVTARAGGRVMGGPFAGMIYDGAASEGAGVARLLGSYEAALAPIFARILETGYGQIMDIGCAEGYYAVGLARELPAARVFAYDRNLDARTACAALAAANDVAQRITLAASCAPADFARCAAQGTLVLCDIEGGEDALLNPALAPDLARADILVEVHDCYSHGLSDRLTARFAATHDVQKITRRSDDTALPPWAEGLSDLDRLLMLWEWRIGPTPWLWMTAKT